jgi:hypothetical protein
MYPTLDRLIRRAGLVATLVLLVGGCGTPPATRAARPPSPGPSASASAAASADSAAAAPARGQRRCTASGDASPSWVPSDRQPTDTPAIVSASVSGDTFTVTFAHGTPAFRSQPQSSAQFTGAASGVPITLAATAGVAIRLTGFRGDTVNNRGPQRLTANSTLLREVRQIGDFEGTVSWGAGLAAPGCASVERTGSTLTFRFIPLPASSPLVAVLEGGTGGFGASAVDLVTLDGRTVARAAYIPRRRPYVGNAGAMLQPDAQVGSAGVYVMDGNGAVHLLRPSGVWSTVATFAMTPDQHEAWFAVSPAGDQLLAGVLSLPAKGPADGTPWPPLVGTSRFDLESATAGGPTRVLAHSESATWPNQPGSGVQTIFPVGWTAAGPVALVGAPVATQNVWAGGALFTIEGGRPAGQVAGDCSAAWVLESGLAPCTTMQLDVTVRDAAGNVRWRPGLDGFNALGLRLAPTGDAITNGRVVAIRGGGTTELPAGFVGQAWLDAATVAGRAANGDAAYVRLDSLGTVHDLGVRGDAVGAVPAAG